MGTLNLPASGLVYADTFLANDRGFMRISGLPVLVLDDILASH